MVFGNCNRIKCRLWIYKMWKANQAARVQFGPPLCTKTAGGRALPQNALENWKSSACSPKPFAGRGRRFIKDREWGDENGKGKGWGWVLGVILLHAVRGTDAAVLPCEQSGLECDNLFTLPLFSPSHSVHSWSLKSFNRFNACTVSILATVFRCTRYSEYPRW